MLEGPNTKYRFFKHPRADNSAVRGRIWFKFELNQDIINVFVTLNYEEDLIKIEGARVATTQNNDFSNTQGQLGRSDLAEIRTHPRYYSCPC